MSRRGELVSERTIAEAMTDEHGQWSLPVTFPTGRDGLWLRALCVRADGLGAVVSDPLHVQLPAPLSPPAGAPSFPAPSPPSPGAAPAPS